MLVEPTLDMTSQTLPGLAAAVYFLFMLKVNLSEPIINTSINKRFGLFRSILEVECFQGFIR